MKKKNYFFLPVSLPLFILFLAFPFMVLALLSVLEISPASQLQEVLGLSVLQAVALYLTVLMAGIFNVPVHEFKSGRDSEEKTVPYLGSKYTLPVWHGHNTVVSLNLGGCLVAMIAAIYLAVSLPLLPVILSIIAVSLGVFILSKPSRSIGFYVPMYVPPLLAVLVSLVALYVYGADLASLARLSLIAGVTGTLVGTTLLNIPRLRKIGTSFISVGGLGCFDGIVLNALVSTIIACMIVSLPL
ncbi:DUF1614 domain-containing protein [Methanocella sp. MCL-LM]|uniref:DUF1614 domain-containing protein n=1 Tax=Methanocella sp. MCL-LM TaxID=3412035 RepID=UPI003C71E617